MLVWLFLVFIVWWQNRLKMWNVILESGGTNNGIDFRIWICVWIRVIRIMVGELMKLHSYVLIGSCILTFILLACILSFKLDPAGSERFYWDLPEIEKSDPGLDSDPTEKFADTTDQTTLTKISNPGPTPQKSFIGRPPSLYGPRVYRTLAQN